MNEAIKIHSPHPKNNIWRHGKYFIGGRLRRKHFKGPNHHSATEWYWGYHSRGKSVWKYFRHWRKNVVAFHHSDSTRCCNTDGSKYRKPDFPMKMSMNAFMIFPLFLCRSHFWCLQKTEDQYCMPQTWSLQNVREKMSSVLSLMLTLEGISIILSLTRLTFRHLCR